jgi:chaperone modulatory protein CbpM
LVEALLDDLWLDMSELCRLAGVSEGWLRQCMDQDLLASRQAGRRDEGRFNEADLRRVRRIAHLEREFDAAPELAALVADLEDEIAALRARMRRLSP